MAEGDECCGRRRLKQTTTSGTLSQHRAHCISFDSYIKPQLCRTFTKAEESCISFDSYIKPQLPRGGGFSPQRCISFDSYIKPQLSQER